MVTLLLPQAFGQAQVQIPTAEETLHVFIKKSLILNSLDPLRRVSVTDPEIASAVIISPTQVLVNGLAPGNVSLILWDEQERTHSFDLQVEFSIGQLSDLIQQTFPQEAIQVRQSDSSLVLSGTVEDSTVEEGIVALAKAQTPNVIDLMVIQEERKDAVLLQVVFAEVDRAEVQAHGINLFSTGAGNTLGMITTGQFDQPVANVGSVPPDVQRGTDPQRNNLVSGGIGNKLGGSPGVFGLNDLLNIFLFRTDANIGVTIKALQQQNILEILAEPNVLALNGREASFLAGGEFPFPVVQGGANVGSVTIQFKEFGVRLTFTPNIQKDGKILLKVVPEVSALDFANALTISGFLIPALSTRRAETEVYLEDGQSFAIAGLIDNRLTEIASKVPGLGDIPFIGALFKSRSLNRSNTELMVVVTPKLVNPLEDGQTLPTPSFPEPFMDKESFDQE
jgi:pilus assembly protein CpaC